MWLRFLMEITISDVGGVTVNTNTVVQPSCFGLADGSIDVSLVGPATKIEWSNGSTNEDLSGVGAGKYQIKVTDAKGCLTIKEFILENPSKLISELNITQPSCGDTNGIIALNVAGGTGSYTFKWNTGSTNDSLIGITSGLYSAEIKDGAGCIDSVFATVNDSGAPVILLKRLVPTNCNQSQGEISIVVASDSLRSVLWSNGDSTTQLTGLAAGRYHVTASDLAGCASHASYKVNLIKPSSQPICMTTVDTITGLTKLIQNVTNVNKVRIYTSNSGTDLGLFQELPSTQNLINDFAVSFAAGTKTYGMSVVDACGNESELSAVHRPIYLISRVDVSGNIFLEWSHYEGFTVVDYEIVRMSNKGNVVVRSLTYPASSVVISDETYDGDFIKYVVRAKTPENCSSDPYFNYTWSNLSSDFSGYNVRIDEGQYLGAYRIYPNPNKGEFKIELNVAQIADVNIVVQDLRGRVILNETHSGMTGFNVIPIQLTGLANGMYQMIIEAGDGEKIIEKIQVTR